MTIEEVIRKAVHCALSKMTKEEIRQMSMFQSSDYWKEKNDEVSRDN